jgi:hypothetical protein
MKIFAIGDKVVYNSGKPGEVDKTGVVTSVKLVYTIVLSNKYEVDRIEFIKPIFNHINLGRSIVLFRR